MMILFNILNIPSSGSILQDMIGIVSLLVTIMGLAFAIYFVVIDLKEKNLKKIEDEIAHKQTEIQEKLERLQVDHLDKMYSHQIELAKESITDPDVLRKMQESVRYSRAKLATQSKFLSPEVRKQRIIELSKLGDQSDIADLEKIIEDPTENKEIKEFAWGIRDIIKGRIMGQQSDATGNVFQNSTPPSSHTSNTQDDPFKKPQIDSSIALMIIIVFLIAALLIK